MAGGCSLDPSFTSIIAEGWVPSSTMVLPSFRKRTVDTGHDEVEQRGRQVLPAPVAAPPGPTRSTRMPVATCAGVLHDPGLYVQHHEREERPHNAELDEGCPVERVLCDGEEHLEGLRASLVARVTLPAPRRRATRVAAWRRRWGGKRQRRGGRRS